ncbi:Sec-independent protein translocase subunit TatA/TatB [Halorussus amylolyticus]|uniref:Sec-independent protein translocase subunit TatA/TatB n=1 Tax=Halorussus amylolyticus TaxID=1126242 RepID=UPI00104FFA00|nr:twin-arginine translocase TatA/TatE family subunit [Halorussus amylolyticus]
MLPTPLFGPIPGGMEMMIILLIAVLLFGADKLPKLARASGEAMGEFKKGREQVERDIREATATDRDAEFEASTAEFEDERPNV